MENGAEVTEGLEGFVEIVGHGSLTAAAHAMGIPRSTLSRHLARLEHRMGVRLLHRSTRRIVLTRAGEEFFARARRIVEDTRAAVEAVRRHDEVPRGKLRVTMPPNHDSFPVEPILDFVRLFPEVELELDATSRVVDLVAEGFDVAIRGGATAPADHVRRPLYRSDLVAVASPAYLDRVGRPESPEALVDHALILGFDAAHQPERTWPRLPRGAIPVTGSMATNDLVLRRTAVLRGDGITLLPVPAVRHALHKGDLEIVLPQHVGVVTHLAIVYPERAFIAPKVRAFVDHLLAWAANLPPDPCAERCPHHPHGVS